MSTTAGKQHLFDGCTFGGTDLESTTYGLQTADDDAGRRVNREAFSNQLRKLTDDDSLHDADLTPELSKAAAF